MLDWDISDYPKVLLSFCLKFQLCIENILVNAVLFGAYVLLRVAKPRIFETETHTGSGEWNKNVPGSRKGIERIMLEKCHFWSITSNHCWLSCTATLGLEKIRNSWYQITLSWDFLAWSRHFLWHLFRIANELCHANLLPMKKSDNLSYFCITNNNKLTKSHENIVTMLGFSKPNCNTLYNCGLHIEFNFHWCTFCK